MARHALCLGAAAVGAEGGGGGYEDGVLGGHGFWDWVVGWLWVLVGFLVGELLLLGNWLVFHQRGSWRYLGYGFYSLRRSWYAD